MTVQSEIKQAKSDKRAKALNLGRAVFLAAYTATGDQMAKALGYVFHAELTKGKLDRCVWKRRAVSAMMTADLRHAEGGLIEAMDSVECDCCKGD